MVLQVTTGLHTTTFAYTPSGAGGTTVQTNPLDHDTTSTWGTSGGERIDGRDRRARRRQRSDGELLLPAPEERPYRGAWPTREQLRIAIVTWIERTYHRRRRQERLGRLTPIEYETIIATPATQAA